MDIGSNDYGLLQRQAAALIAGESNLIANAANLASLLFHELRDVNWAGFYFVESDGSLVLGPFSGRPACTRLPAGRGVCGKAVREGRTTIVDDVSAFADHIVCDAASQSEIVVPLIRDARVFGVLDIDSPTKARFSERDAAGLECIAAHFAGMNAI